MYYAIPYMKKNKFGRILNCSSNAWRGTANLSAYSAGNSGVVGLTKASAKELYPFGITVNAYCPQADSPGHILEFTKTIRSLDEEMRPDKENLSQSVIFPRGEDYKGFSNTAYLNMILGFDHPSNCSIGNVTFGPGAHNNWHRHFGYQVLMVTGGEGYYREWGKKADLVILDDNAAKKTAKYLGLPVSGTLGVLIKAKRMGIIEHVQPLITEMRKNGFYVSDTVERMVLEQACE